MALPTAAAAAAALRRLRSVARCRGGDGGSPTAAALAGGAAAAGAACSCEERASSAGPPRSWNELVRGHSPSHGQQQQLLPPPHAASSRPTLQWSGSGARRTLEPVKKIRRSMARHGNSSRSDGDGKTSKTGDLWSRLRKAFTQSSVAAVLQQYQESAQSDSFLQELGLHNMTSQCRKSWLKIRFRNNKRLMREIEHKEEGALDRYYKTRDLINDIKLWKHGYGRHLQSTESFVKLETEAFSDDKVEYIEGMEKLKDEARRLGIASKRQVIDVMSKIYRLYDDETIKYSSVYRAKPKIRAMVLSFPAYEVCTLPMQAAFQFVLTEVMQGEGSMLFPMLRDRGLPIHPGILTQSTAVTAVASGAGAKLSQAGRPTVGRRLAKSTGWLSPKVTKDDDGKQQVNHIRVNRALQCLPPAKPGYSRNLTMAIQQLLTYRDVLT